MKNRFTEQKTAFTSSISDRGLVTSTHNKLKQFCHQENKPKFRGKNVLLVYLKSIHTDFHSGQITLIQQCIKNAFCLQSLLFLKNYLFYVFEYFACTYACTPHVCLVSKEVRRRHLSSQNWSYGSLHAAMWLLGIQPVSSARVASTLRHILSCHPAFIYYPGPNDKGWYSSQ